MIRAVIRAMKILSCSGRASRVLRGMLSPLPARQLVRHAGAVADLGQCVSVMTFNVLAQCYTRSEFFPSVSPKAALKWKNRAPKIIEEIVQYSPDVVCLQEVDAFDDFFVPQLALHHYEGVWQKKSERKQDGVAIFWKTPRFALAARDHIEFGLKDGVGLVVCLNRDGCGALGGQPRSLCVANTHLFWNPKMEYIKLSQAQMYLRHAADFAAGRPLVVCGDMNSMPGSDCFNLFTRRQVTHTHTPALEDDEASGDVVSDAVPVTDTYSHTLELRAAYDPMPAFTTLTDTFRGTLDHIFLSPQFTSHAHLDMFAEETILEETSLPSSRYPSDHMACMVLLTADGL